MNIFKKIFILVSFLYTLLIIPNNNYINIIHFNDVYQMYPGYELLGASKFSTFIKKLPNNSIKIFSGDILSPSKTSFISKGQHMIDILNELNVHYCTIGNHELDYGIDNMEQKLKYSNCTWILSNIYKKINNTKVKFKNIINHKVINTKIGNVLLLGLSENWLKSTRLVESDFIYDNMIINAKNIIHKIKKKYNKLKIIAITHSHIEKDIELLKAIPDINLILGGHDHIFYTYKYNNRYIVKSSSDFNGVSLIKMYDNDIQIKQYNLLDINLNMEDDTNIQKIYNKYNYNNTFNKILGNTGFSIDLRNNICRLKQCVFGQWVADIFKNKFNLDNSIVFINAGTIRSQLYISSGILTYNNILTIFPYQADVVVIQVSGEIIIDCLKKSNYKKGKGSYLIYSSNLIKLNNKYLINNELIDINKTYNLITIDFLTLGKDGYSNLKKKVKVKYDLHKLLIEYFSNK